MWQISINITIKSWMLPPRFEKMMALGLMREKLNSILFVRHHTALLASNPDKKTIQSNGTIAITVTQSVFLKILYRLVTHCDFEFLYVMLSESKTCTSKMESAGRSVESASRDVSVGAGMKQILIGTITR